MTSRELRQSFLDFFAQRDHRVMPSAPLKPTDATTLFTSAGMQPFVPWFRGLVPPEAPRVATCQKCFRADDVEEVGRTPWHLTFFEMLGNFSFGDYFKREAIVFAWEYVTDVLSLPKSRVWITVHPEDEESPEVWAKEIGVARSRIIRDETNWWGPVGDSGPCGPNTELHIDTGEDRGCGRPDCGPTCNCPRFNELWNLVFQIYHKTADGEFEPLPEPGIDTGMGMERLAAVIQEVPSIFGTDLLAPIVSAVVARARRTNSDLRERLGERERTTANVIAEHARGLAFLLADGFTPSNEGAGYVLRRLLRRASRLGRRLGLEEPFLTDLVPAITATMGGVYPELLGTQERISTWLVQEEKQFEDTLERSLGPLMAAIERAQAAGLQVLPGEEAFKLHDTYGLPKELAADIAAESGLEIDEEGFERAMQEQRDRARARAREDFAFAMRSGYQSFAGKTTFLGYSSCVAEGTIIGIIKGGAPVDRLGKGEEAEVFLDRTPFYAEGGGQVGDRGAMTADDAEAMVLNTYHPVEGVHAHSVRVEQGELRPGQSVAARVDEERRRAIARAHTATHLLHHVLRQVLGEHAVQSGSLVDADRLRFDFAHFSALTDEERQRIEEGVLELALQDSELSAQEMSWRDAQDMGAIALFGEKYGERVRVVQIGDFSKELCGGTHLVHAGSIGGFFVMSETSIGAGLRRIEAITGREAQALAVRHRHLLGEAAQALQCRLEYIPARLEALGDEVRSSRRKLDDSKRKEFEAYVRAWIDRDIGQHRETVAGVSLVAERVASMPPDALRTFADRVLAAVKPGIVVLGCEHEGRAHFAAKVSEELVRQGYHAGDLIREVAKVAGGGGGGRPDFAQAGGRDPERLHDALARAKELVAGHEE